MLEGLRLAARKLDLVTYLTAENLALRQQLLVLKRNQKRSQIKKRDRLFWVAIFRIWSGWRDALVIVNPDTVVRWHRQGFKLYWRRKCRGGTRGRPPLDPTVKALVFKIADANPTWGAPKIHGELLKLGIEISERSVSGLLFRRNPKSPSQTWKTFIKIHMTEMVGVDFLVVPTIRFRMLFVFVVLSHAQRQVIHFNVTAHPTAEWIAQQIYGSFSVGHDPKISAQGARRFVRKLLSETRLRTGNRGGLDGLSKPLAERLCRTAEREHPPRMFGPRNHLERTSPTESSRGVFRVLQRRPNALGTRQGDSDGSPHLEEGFSFLQID